jgi:phosphohistidine phosphatase SixA
VKRRTEWVCLLALMLLLATPGVTDAEEKRRQELVPRFKGPEIVAKLKQGGYVIMLRHMATVHSPDSLYGVDLEDCTTQRILSEEGQQQARDLGEAFRKLDIQVGQVYVSPYCRTRETSKLAFGREGEISDTLSVWDELEVEEKTARGTEIRQMLDTPPTKPGTNTVLVTHTGNLLWSFGLDSRPEGLSHVFKPTGLSIGRASYLGMVRPEEWRSLSGMDAAAPQP